MLKFFTRLEKTRNFVLLVFAILMVGSLVFFYTPSSNQALANLSTTNWTTPALSPAISNGLNRVTVPDPTGNSFFRLRKP